MPQYSQLKRASVRRVTARELKNIAMLSQVVLAGYLSVVIMRAFSALILQYTVQFTVPEPSGLGL